MNSSLQCLSHIEILYKELSIRRNQNKLLSYNFLNLLDLMHKTQELDSFTPKNIWKIMVKNVPKYSSKQQQDANEFISNFLDVIHNELNSEKESEATFDISNEQIKESFDDFYFYKENKSPIINIFYGNFINLSICQNGHTYEFDFNSFNMLELSIFDYLNQNKIKLESLIKNNSKKRPLGIEEI